MKGPFHYNDNIESEQVKMEGSCNNHITSIFDFKDEDNEWKMLIKALQELPLQNFGIIKPLYDDLMQIPKNQRKSQDVVLIILLQKILEFNEQLVMVSKQEEESTRIWNAALSISNEEIRRLTNDLHAKTSFHECDKKLHEEKITCLTIQLQQALSEKDQFCNQIQQLSHELVESKQHLSHHLQQLQLQSPSNNIDTHELKSEVEKWTTEICKSNTNTRYIEQYAQCDGSEEKNSLSNQNSKFILKNRLDDILCSLQKLPSIDTNDCQILSEEIQKISTNPLVQNNILNDSYETSSKNCNGLHQNQQIKIITSCSEQHVSFYLKHISQELQKLFTTIVSENDILQSKTNKLQETIELEKHNIQKIKTIFQNELQFTLSKLATERQELEVQLEVITNDCTKISFEKNSLKHDIEIKKNECIDISLKNDLLKNENLKLKNELTKASLENGSLQQDIERMTIEFKEIHLQKCLIESKVQKTTIDLKKVYSDKELLQLEVESLKKKLINISSETDVLQLEVERLTNELPKKFLIEKDILQHEIVKFKEELHNEKKNSKNSKQAFQEELQDVISTWVIQKQNFEIQIEKLLEDVTIISLEKDTLQHDFDKFKFIIEYKTNNPNKDSCFVSIDQNNKTKRFCAKKNIPFDVLQHTREELQQSKVPSQFVDKTSIIHEPYKSKESPCVLKCEGKEKTSEGRDFFCKCNKHIISDKIPNEFDMQQQLERLSKKNARLELKEETKMPTKLNPKEQIFEQRLSHSLYDMSLENAFAKKPQQCDVQVLHYKESIQNEIDKIKWAASKLAQEEMNLEDLQQPFSLKYI